MAAKPDPTPGRAAYARNLVKTVLESPDEMRKAIANPPGGMWRLGAYMHEETTFGFGCYHLVLKPDGTYFLHDDSG